VSEPPRPPSGPRPEAWWSQGHLAWPAAIAIGFAATALGLAFELPGAAAGLAALALLPLYVRVLDRRGPGLAGFLLVAWALGCGGAVLGQRLEQGALDAAIPLAGAPRAWLTNAPDAPWGAPEGLALAWGAVCLLVARPARGLLALPLLAQGVATVVGTLPTIPESAAVLEALLGLPPSLYGIGLGVHLALPVLAARGLPALATESPARAPVLASGLGCAVVSALVGAVGGAGLQAYLRGLVA
jgi:hypothetical protein